MRHLINAIAMLLFMQYGYTFKAHAQGAVTDTIGWSAYQQSTETLYASPNGGYVFGNNGYGDIAKAKVFSGDSCGRIDRILFKFGAKSIHSQDPDSRLIVRLYSIGGIGYTSSGIDSTAGPGAQILDSEGNSYTKFISMSDIDTSGGFTVVDIDVDFGVDPCFWDFAVGIDFSDLSQGDTVGLLSTTDGDVDNEESSWDLTSSNKWVTILNDVLGWGLDAEPAIFPVFTRIVGVEDRLKIAPLAVYPNPCNGVASLSVQEAGVLSVSTIAGKLLL
ncbi:MAG: hypothetical protein ACI9FU_001834, partial [Granulosicoccus sp.]